MKSRKLSGFKLSFKRERINSFFAAAGSMKPHCVHVGGEIMQVGAGVVGKIACVHIGGEIMQGAPVTLFGVSELLGDDMRT